MSITEAAKVLGLSERTVHRWIRDGKLNASKVNRQWQVEVDTVKDSDKDTGNDNDKDIDKTALLEQLQSENAHLREQLSRRDRQIEAFSEQIDHLTQLLALKEKNVAALTEQLDDSRRLIEDMRRPWWKRVFRR